MASSRTPLLDLDIPLVQAEGRGVWRERAMNLFLGVAELHGVAPTIIRYNAAI